MVPRSFSHEFRILSMKNWIFLNIFEKNQLMTFPTPKTGQSVSAITNSGSTVPGYSLIETTESQISHLNGYELIQYGWGYAKYSSSLTD